VIINLRLIELRTGISEPAIPARHYASLPGTFHQFPFPGAVPGGDGGFRRIPKTEGRPSTARDAKDAKERQ
jgi:hypothetical protein